MRCVYNSAVLSTLPLRIGQAEYLLCWRLDDCQGAGSGKPAALTFYDQGSALYFLRSVITDSGQMHDLRLWLLDQHHSFAMYAINDDEMMGRVALMLASGELAAASMEKGAGEDEGEIEGILRRGGGGSAVTQRVVETTPLQDETERRQSATEAEEIVLGSETTEEEPPVLAASVDADQPPAMADTAAVEEHPKLAADAEVEEAPALDLEAEAGEQPALTTEAAVEGPPALGTEAVVDAPPALTTDVDVPEAPAVDTDVEVDKPPTDHHD